jgi:hypothetical protein
MGATELAGLLAGLVKALIDYKTARDKVQEAGDVVDDGGVVKTDAELIELFRNDAATLRDETAAMLAKYGASADPPTDPPVDPAA